MSDNILTIFPTTVLSSTIDRDFTDDELNFINQHKLQTRPNLGNTQSRNLKILECDEMKDIKQFIESKIKYYFREIMCINDNVDVYITISWLNFTDPGQYHHEHNHRNSFLSGVLYINGDGDNDKMTMISELAKLNSVFDLKVSKYNYYNSESWWLPANTGTLYLFPSSIRHKVEETKSDETRISLAFNTFIKGKLGSEEELTDLVL